MQRRTNGGSRSAGIAGALRGWLMGAAALVLLPLMLVSCTNRDAPVNADTRIGTAPPVGAAGVTLSNLLDDPGKFTGQTVTVSGEVNDVLGPKAFTIGGEEFLPPGELLVVSPTGFPAIPDYPENEYLVDDDIVQVTGTVRTFVQTEVARQVDADDMEGQAYVRWEGKPVLVVTSMITTPRARTGSTAAGTSGGSTAPLTDMLVIVTAPDRLPLVGKSVQLTGVKVQSVVADRAFWIGPSVSQRLFVVLDETPTPGTATEGKVNVNAGQTISVRGTLRKLPLTAEAQKQWGLTAADTAPLQNEVVYLQAEHVDVQSR